MPKQNFLSDEQPHSGFKEMLRQQQLEHVISTHFTEAGYLVEWGNFSVFFPLKIHATTKQKRLQKRGWEVKYNSTL